MGKRLVVFGAGAIGGQVGARLFAAGHDMTLIEPWPPQLETIQDRGLKIEDETGSTHLFPPILHPRKLHRLYPIDVLFLAVKSYDSESAMEMIIPYLSPTALVVSMQNSINEEIIKKKIEVHRILGCVLLINAVLKAPGHICGSVQSVSRSSDPDLPGAYIGEYQGAAGEKAQEVTGYMNTVWITRTTDSLMKMRWTKLATSAMINALSGITGLRSSSLLSKPEIRKIIIQLGAQVVNVATAHGHSIDRLIGNCTPQQILKSSLGQSRVMEERLAMMADRINPSAVTSLLQDHWNGRLTEVDFFNGLVVKKGYEKGISTPFNQVILEFMHQIERGEMRSEVKALEQLSSMLNKNTFP